jgi:hypothetical protein
VSGDTLNLTPESSIPRLGRLACISIFAVALVARLAATAAAGFETLRFGDARAYLFAAQELVRTGHYPLKTEPFYFRAPGYPVFLVAATLGHPDRIALAKFANCVLGAVAALLLAGLSAHIFSRRNVAIATGVAAALAPGFVYLSTDIQSEPLFLVLLLASGWLLLVSADRPSSNLAVLAGAALALAALTRPTALVLAPLLAAPLADHRRPPRVRAHLAASALLGFALALGPWTLRNAVVYRDFVPVNDAGGSAFYQGNSDWMARFYRLKSPDEYRAWTVASFADLERQTRAAEAVQPNSPSAKSRYFLRKTFEERRGDPAGWARLLLRKAFDWMRPYPNPLFWPAWAVWSVGVFYTVLTLLAIVGFLRAPRTGVRAFSLLFLALTMAAHVAIIVVWRYRIPYWDPVLILYAAAAIPLTHAGPGSQGEDSRGAPRFESSSSRSQLDGSSASFYSRDSSRSEARSESSITSTATGRSPPPSGPATGTVWAPEVRRLCTDRPGMWPFSRSAHHGMQRVAMSGSICCRAFSGDARRFSLFEQLPPGVWRPPEPCLRAGSWRCGRLRYGRRRSLFQRIFSSPSFPPDFSPWRIPGESPARP